MEYIARVTKLDATPVMHAGEALVILTVDGKHQLMHRDEFDHVFSPAPADAVVVESTTDNGRPVRVAKVAPAKPNGNGKKAHGPAPSFVTKAMKETGRKFPGFPDQIQDPRAERARCCYSALLDGPKDQRGVADWCDAHGWSGAAEDVALVGAALAGMRDKGLVEKEPVLGGKWSLVKK